MDAVEQHGLALVAQRLDGPRGVEELAGEVVVRVLGIDDPEFDVALRREPVELGAHAAEGYRRIATPGTTAPIAPSSTPGSSGWGTVLVEAPAYEGMVLAEGQPCPRTQR